MADRYFSETPLRGESAMLAGHEAHHLLHVMRAKIGTEIIVFDGNGGEWWAEITKLGRADVERELSHELTLAIALPKGDRQRWLVEKAVELGVARIVPITTSRSTASAAEPPAKLARYVIEASKQCGRNRLLEIAKPQPWCEIISQVVQGNLLLAHPGGKPLVRLNRELAAPTTLAIGPEGGFTEEEVTLGMDHGWQLVGLGERILRIETAALVLVAQLTAE
jgi:16S rRNA (uracil1498-N3)-methyltransferase